MYCRRVSEVEIKISETVKKISIICSFFMSITLNFTKSNSHVRVTGHICLEERMCGTQKNDSQKKRWKKKREKPKTEKRIEC